MEAFGNKILHILETSPAYEHVLERKKEEAKKIAEAAEAYRDGPLPIEFAAIFSGSSKKTPDDDLVPKTEKDFGLLCRSAFLWRRASAQFLYKLAVTSLTTSKKRPAAREEIIAMLRKRFLFTVGKEKKAEEDVLKALTFVISRETAGFWSAFLQPLLGQYEKEEAGRGFSAKENGPMELDGRCNSSANKTAAKENPSPSPSQQVTAGHYLTIARAIMKAKTKREYAALLVEGLLENRPNPFVSTILMAFFIKKLRFSAALCSEINRYVLTHSEGCGGYFIWHKLVLVAIRGYHDALDLKTLCSIYSKGETPTEKTIVQECRQHLLSKHREQKGRLCSEGMIDIE